MYQAHARNKREFGEASPFRQNFQDGGAIAAGVATAPLAIIAAAEAGAGVAASQGLRYLTQLNYASAGRWALRKEFLIKGGFNLLGQTYSNAVKGEAKLDVVGLLLDMYFPNSVSTVGGAFIEGGYDFESGGAYTDNSTFGVGLSKMMLGFGLVRFGKGVGNFVGPNVFSKTATTTAEGVMTIFADLGEAMIEKIGEQNKDRQPKK
jgi:hypothetical protein